MFRSRKNCLKSGKSYQKKFAKKYNDLPYDAL